VKFGIIGDPVDHSRSPAIHNAGFAALGIEATFEFVPTPPSRFGDAEQRLRSGSLSGASVTMPHKANAYAAVDVMDPMSDRARAVNTIVGRRGVLTGYNTDIDGVRYAIEKLGLTRDTPILLLGYGAAAAAALVSFSSTTRISISGRNKSPAITLTERIGVEAEFVEWGDPRPGVILVNATPLGMHSEELPADVLRASVGLVDMTYGARETPAVTDSRTLGIPCSDGLDMLVGQAVAAFELFTGEAAPVDVLEAAARA